MSARSAWLAAALAVGLTGCGQRSGERGPVAGPSRAGRPPVVPVSAQGIGALVSRPGARATLVNVWATWCGPCRKEFPALLRVARARGADGLRLVLVSADLEDQVAVVRGFLADQGV